MNSVCEQTLDNACRQLLDSRAPGGWWEGELSGSALSTATAVFALALYEQEKRGSAGDAPALDACRRLVRSGLHWIITRQNADGGWGDTLLSISNISTTALCWAALTVGTGETEQAATGAETWLRQHAGSLEPGTLSRAIAGRYGKDHTFSVPILTMCALAGRLGKDPWRFVPQLPFELAALPRHWFRFLRLPVVSYALPALIAMGLVRHARRKSWNPIARVMRSVCTHRVVSVIDQIQPAGGGFLEATPLTSFVVMSLIGAGQIDHPVVSRGVEFLIRSFRPDGCWPIDANLATWCTTLSVNALNSAGRLDLLGPEGKSRVRAWLLGQHHRRIHPYTQAPPGGWAWTDLSGGVPDADDTAGALVALHHLGPAEPGVREAAAMGVQWLLDLQNRDGGIPTFCRGWGRLPFDRSGADLTAHAVLAWRTWLSEMPSPLAGRARAAMTRALDYLRHAQRPDGTWIPLWFGNQHAVEDENPMYGTARVLIALATVPKGQDMVGRAVDWLLASQNPDGGWGGCTSVESSIEETALATQALAVAGGPSGRSATARGRDWLAQHTDDGRRFPPSPIGFYFAKLWYFEKLYPLVFTIGAMGVASTCPARD